MPCAVFAETEIEAQVIRHQEGDGLCLVSSGFPLPQGLVSEKNIINGNIRVYVKNDEVPANITGLRGRHYDETLRSILIQFVYPMKQNQKLFAKIVIGGTPRSFPDPLYHRPTYEIVKNNNVIFPVGTDYLVSTNIYFRNLLPIGEGSDLEEKFFTDLAENRFDYLALKEAWATADYEDVSAKIGLWCRFGGEIKFWNEALKETLRWLNYNTPNPALSPPCKAIAANPDSRDVSHNHCGIPAEWHAPRFYSFAQMYLLTGYRDFWGIVAYNVQRQQQAIINEQEGIKKIISTGYFDRPRFNYANRLSALIPAFFIDATYPESGTYFTGREFNWGEQFEWTISGILYHAWDLKWISFDNGNGIIPEENSVISQNGVTATLLGVYSPTMNHPRLSFGSDMPVKGYLQIKNLKDGSFKPGALGGISASATSSEMEDYRQGLVGTRSNSLRNKGSGELQENPIFQYSFLLNFLIDYYLYVQRDDRIPNVIKTVVDIVLLNTRELSEGDSLYKSGWGSYGVPTHGHPYQLYIPVDAGAACYTLPMFSRALSFTILVFGDLEVSDKLYSDWYKIMINTGNANPRGVLNWSWKHFGQFYGWSQDAPWMMAQNSLLEYGPKKLREPLQYHSIPGDHPDIARETNFDVPSIPMNMLLSK